MISVNKEEGSTAVTSPNDRIVAHLDSSELQQAQQLADSLDLTAPDSCPSFGRALSQETSRLTDELLQQIRSNDKDIIGDQLNQIVRLAHDTHSQMAFEQKSWKHQALQSVQQVPLVGGAVRRLVRKYQTTQDSFHSAAHQIDTVIAELGASVEALQHTNVVFNQMHSEVMAQVRQLEIHIHAGNLALAKAEQRDAEFQARKDLTDLEMQQWTDLQAAMASLRKRIADLRILQQSALQTLPNIRLIQANNIQLVEKFQTIQDVTIPAWKQGFVIRGALTQQQHAVRLARAIDDTTNQLLLQNSQMLHTNSIETAKANQRLVIDVDTLSKTAEALFKTAEEVVQIRRTGRIAHDTALLQLENVRNRTRTLIAGGGSG